MNLTCQVRIINITISTQVSILSTQLLKAGSAYFAYSMNSDHTIQCCSEYVKQIELLLLNNMKITIEVMSSNGIKDVLQCHWYAIIADNFKILLWLFIDYIMRNS